MLFELVRVCLWREGENEEEGRERDLCEATTAHNENTEEKRVDGEINGENQRDRESVCVTAVVPEVMVYWSYPWRDWTEMVRPSGEDEEKTITPSQ